MNCKNCYTDYTPMWRNGYCNACALHYTRNGYYKDPVKIYAKVLMDISKGTNSSILKGNLF